MPNERPRRGNQVIPRPDNWQPGAPAPWTSWLSSERSLDLASIRRTLAAAADPLPAADVRSYTRESAVLVPLYEDQGQPWLILTRRSAHLRAHSGEVSFPGGRRDAGESLADTARREAHEEINLDPTTVEIIGELDLLTTVSSASVISPLVGVLPNRPSNLVANPAEVDHILHLPLTELLDPDHYRSEIWTRGDEVLEITFFDVEGDTIWGATARILRQFFELVTSP